MANQAFWLRELNIDQLIRNIPNILNPATTMCSSTVCFSVTWFTYQFPCSPLYIVHKIIFGWSLAHPKSQYVENSMWKVRRWHTVSCIFFTCAFVHWQVFPTALFTSGGVCDCSYLTLLLINPRNKQAGYNKEVCLYMQSLGCLRNCLYSLFPS